MTGASAASADAPFVFFTIDTIFYFSFCPEADYETYRIVKVGEGIMGAPTRESVASSISSHAFHSTDSQYKGAAPTRKRATSQRFTPFELATHEVHGKITEPLFRPALEADAPASSPEAILGRARFRSISREKSERCVSSDFCWRPDHG
jgi:hypothetical protein